jgi:hypothetical protein
MVSSLVSPFISCDEMHPLNNSIRPVPRYCRDSGGRTVRSRAKSRLRSHRHGYRYFPAMYPKCLNTDLREVAGRRTLKVLNPWSDGISLVSGSSSEADSQKLDTDNGKFLVPAFPRGHL